MVKGFFSVNWYHNHWIGICMGCFGADLKKNKNKNVFVCVFREDSLSSRTELSRICVKNKFLCHSFDTSTENLQLIVESIALIRRFPHTQASSITEPSDRRSALNSNFDQSFRRVHIKWYQSLVLSRFNFHSIFLFFYFSFWNYLTWLKWLSKF